MQNAAWYMNAFNKIKAPDPVTGDCDMISPRTAQAEHHQCREVRMLSIAGELAQRQFLLRNLQPYRVESVSGHSQG